MKKYFLFFLLIIFLLSSIAVAAQSDNMPIGLQKIKEENQRQTENFAVQVSFIIAFLAGMIGILSPCILPFLPAYFSYTFKEKKNITLMTFIFFLGFSLVFVAMGVIAGFIGERSLVVLQLDWLVMLAGALLIVMGFMSLLGKGFGSFIKMNKKFENDIPGTFLFGIAFAIGWTACLGPILAGILGIGALLHNVAYSALLLFFYSLGNLVPLFILAVFYDRLKLWRTFLKGKTFKFNIDDKEYEVHSTNLVAGILFIAIGLFLIIFKNTAPVNSWDLLGTKNYFYSIQNAIINWPYANIVGGLVLLLFVAVIGYFIWNNYKNLEE